MARIRTIKPEFFTSLSVASLEVSARLTFIGLWTHCDDLGRCVDEARLIKAALWPLDDRTAADVEGDLQALHRASLIRRYEVDGRRYLAISGWAEHQKINRPSPSKFPAPPVPRDPHGGLTEGSVSPPPDGGSGVHEPSHQGEMSVSGKTGASTGATGPNGPTSADAPPDPALNCGNGITESSVSAHGAFTEDSPPERKGTGNREQGKEQGSPVTAVGGLTDRNARASEAPSAQPENFFARSVITGIPRYRDAPGWVKKKYLAPMAAAALDAGFSRDAIARYAGMVALEGRYLDRQHIPEFREVLRRLARDTAQDSLCRTCADPACSCSAPPASDRPWTAEDAADLERVLEHLGLTHEDLDTTGTP